MFIDFKNEEEAPYCYHENQPFNWFGPVSHLNILIGSNNCGKSRFIRNLLVEERNSINHKVIIGNAYIKDLYRLKYIIEEKIDLSSRYSLNINRSDINRLRHIIDGHKTIINNINSIVFYDGFFDNLLEEIDNIFANPIKINSFLNQSMNARLFKGLSDFWKTILELNEDSDFFSTVNCILDLYKKIGKEIKVQNISNYEYHYIPTMRCLHRFYSKGEKEFIDEYFIANSIEKNFNLKAKNLNIHSGLNLYEEVKLIRNGSRTLRKQFEEFENFLQKHFFQDSNYIDIVARISKKTNENHVDIYIHGKNHPIHKLGDGVQAIIMVLFPVFTSEENSYVFIEEPEINLHPGFQKILIEKLNELALKRNLKVFMTTQSNHFLDLSSDIHEDVTIHTFEKKLDKKNGDSFLVRNVQNHDRNILKLIGVNNASVFMANCSIWLEGISDRVYVKKYLQAYYNSDEFNIGEKKIYVEDIHYNYFEYAGSNLSHYLYEDIDEKEVVEKIKIQFIANKIFLLADKDKGKQSKHDYLLSIESEYFQYYCLKCLEIENLLSKDQLIEILNNFDKSKDKIKYVNFTRSDYVSKALGRVIDDKLELKPKTFAAASGTLKSYYKTKFYQAFEKSKNVKWETMSKHAQDLIREMYVFIERHNS